MNQIDFFEHMCTLVVLSLLPCFDNVETFGKKFYINPENRTEVSPEFFIRFTGGNTVVFVWDDIRNGLNVTIESADDSEMDRISVDIPYKNTMLSAMNPAVFANIQACKSNPQSWGDGTWCSELHDSILMILNYAEAGKLAELFSKNGIDSNGAKYVNRNPNAEPEQISDVDYYKKLREFKF